ncbi:glycosyltransferase family 4 protein [Kallotenue papyrolyticum]|uniref:glycosyltransferase family 4 protein n=1 Tax=Kallotenue papyrolyticum TaxID=1325125 RepID=UPI00047859C7|nr:glycosyltransferase family 4 protein [Kallotenue papyrolyticum]
MRIAQIAPMYESVPPSHYGGTERVVWSLTEELVRRGHDVTLFASGDSQTSARLVPTTPRSLRRQMSREEILEVSPWLHLAMLSDVLRDASAFDVIHSHVDHYTFPFTRLIATPIVTTLHGRLDIWMLKPILRCYPDAPLVSISRSQRAPLAELPLNWVGCVYNGIPLEHFPFRAQPGDYLVFLGRICPEKRPDWAVEVARRSGMPLKVAAKIDPVDQAYWRTEIEPLFRANQVEFLGEVNEQEKAALLGGAYATLFPIDWPEPFGLVMAESLACGTPVIAMRRGSVPEVLEDGVSGFICDSVAEMIAAVPRVAELDRATCRRRAERFSQAAMADGYEAVYQQVIAARRDPPLAALELVA